MKHKHKNRLLIRNIEKLMRIRFYLLRNSHGSYLRDLYRK